MRSAGFTPDGVDWLQDIESSGVLHRLTAAPRSKHNTAAPSRRKAAIAVKLGLVRPGAAVRQRAHRQHLHRLDEAWPMRSIGESFFVSMGTDYTNWRESHRTCGLNLSFICSS